MLRVPGSHNLKCVNANNGVLDSKTAVKYMQKWNGHRPSMMLLIGNYHAHLVNQKIKQNIRHNQNGITPRQTTPAIIP